MHEQPVRRQTWIPSVASPEVISDSVGNDVSMQCDRRVGPSETPCTCKTSTPSSRRHTEMNQKIIREFVHAALRRRVARIQRCRGERQQLALDLVEQRIVCAGREAGEVSRIHPGILLVLRCTIGMSSWHVCGLSNATMFARLHAWLRAMCLENWECASGTCWYHMGRWPALSMRDNVRHARA